MVNFAVIPLVAFAIGRLWFPDQPAFTLGLLLAALQPSSGMTIASTGFARDNVTAAVKMTVLGLILGSLATPFYVKWLIGATIPVDLVAVFAQIAPVVFLPMLAEQAKRSLMMARVGPRRFRQDWAPRFPPLSTLGVLGIVFVAIALKASDLAARPAILIAIIAPLLLLYMVNHALGTIVGQLFLPRGDAIALVYGTVMRNLSIALALAMNAFGEASADAALIAVAYVIQVESAAWHARLGHRIFGPAPV